MMRGPRPEGCSLWSWTCPACGDLVAVPVLWERWRRQWVMRVQGDVMADHVREAHGTEVP
jgi:hypothetical protein